MDEKVLGLLHEEGYTDIKALGAGAFASVRSSVPLRALVDSSRFFSAPLGRASYGLSRWPSMNEEGGPQSESSML